MKKILNSLNQIAAEAHKAGHVSLAKQISAILKTAAPMDDDTYRTYLKNFDLMDSEQRFVFLHKNPEFLKRLRADPAWANSNLLATLHSNWDSPEDMYKKYILLDAEKKLVFKDANPELADKLKDKAWVDGQILAQSGDNLRAMNKKEEVARGHEKAKTILLSIVNLYNGTGKPPPFLIPSGPLSGQAILDILKMAGMGSKLTGWADLYKRLETIKSKTDSYLIGTEDNPFQASTSAPSKSVAPGTGEGQYPRNPKTDRPRLSFPLGGKKDLVSLK